MHFVCRQFKMPSTFGDTELCDWRKTKTLFVVVVDFTQSDISESTASIQYLPSSIWAIETPIKMHCLNSLTVVSQRFLSNFLFFPRPFLSLSLPVLGLSLSRSLFNNTLIAIKPIIIICLITIWKPLIPAKISVDFIYLFYLSLLLLLLPVSVWNGTHDLIFGIYRVRGPSSFSLSLSLSSSIRTQIGICAVSASLLLSLWMNVEFWYLYGAMEIRNFFNGIKVNIWPSPNQILLTRAIESAYMR